MPTYEYICEKCDHRFEQFQLIKDQPLTVCPKEACPAKKWGKGKVKRGLGGGSGLIFKGSGFYITDYRSEGYKQAAKNDTAAAAAPAKPAAETKSSGAKSDSGGGKSTASAS